MKTMKVIAVGATVALLPALSAPGPIANATEYLEPNVQGHVGVLPTSVCRQLIELGEESAFLSSSYYYTLVCFSNHPYHCIFASCSARFLVQQESIDVTEQNDPSQTFVPSQTVNVYMKGWDKPGLPVPETGHAVRIDNKPIWILLQPSIPKITQIVKDNRNKEAFTEFYPDKPDREPELH